MSNTTLPAVPAISGATPRALAARRVTAMPAFEPWNPFHGLPSSHKSVVGGT